MCGIVGLFLKTDKLESRLGALTAAMLATMSDRGPDSAGFAVYGEAGTGVKLTLRGPDAATLARALADMDAALGLRTKVVSRDTHAIIAVLPETAPRVRGWLTANAPGIDVVSVGERMEIYKEVGLPSTVAARFDLPAMVGTHAIGHTRMATESAGDDQRRPSLLDRYRPVPRPQRFALEP